MLAVIRSWKDVKVKNFKLTFSELRIIYNRYCNKYTKSTRKMYGKTLWQKELSNYLIENYETNWKLWFDEEPYSNFYFESLEL